MMLMKKAGQKPQKAGIGIAFEPCELNDRRMVRQKKRKSGRTVTADIWGVGGGGVVRDGKDKFSWYVYCWQFK